MIAALLELLGRAYLMLCGLGVLAVLAVATWMNLTSRRAEPEATCEEPWYCTPCAFAIVEAHALYHRAEPTS